MIRSIAVVLAAAMAVAAFVAGGAVSATREKNLVATAAAAGRFQTLVTLLRKAGLARTLARTGPYTVFAPTDAAFAKVPKGTLDGLLADKAKLRAALLYHVVRGRVTAAKVAELSSARTLSGKELWIRVSGGRVLVNGAGVTQADIRASNGVMHVVDRVLVPPR